MKYPSVILAIASVCGYSQTNPATHFVVATIKPVHGAVLPQFFGGPGTSDPELVTYSNVKLVDLISDAFSLPPESVEGPAWLSSTSFEVRARVPSGANKDQLREMIKNLLIERFSLVFHRESKRVSGYELALAADGVRITPSVPDLPSAGSVLPAIPPDAGKLREPLQLDAGGFPTVSPHRRWASAYRDDRVRMTFRQSSMAFLADRLAATLRGESNINLPVIDKTDLGGTFDFRLEFRLSPDRTAPSSQLVKDINSDIDPKVVSAALQKQLGLRLVAAKIEIESLVVDHIARTPSDN